MYKQISGIIDRWFTNNPEEVIKEWQAIHEITDIVYGNEITITKNFHQVIFVEPTQTAEFRVTLQFFKIKCPLLMQVEYERFKQVATPYKNKRKE